MRLRGWLWLAVSSLSISASLTGAVRPHYGGTLTVELSNADGRGGNALSMPIAETLVRWNSRGEIEPVLAVAWQHDPDYKRWRFSLRPKVTFHDGGALTGASAAPSLLAALKPKYGDVSIEAGGQAVEVKAEHPMPDLLDVLALPGAAIFRKSDANALIGTGPFRVTASEPGRHLTLASFADYWGGRPYLDAVAIEFGTGRGHADLFDIPVGPARRILPEGLATWSSAPRTLVAIASTNADPALLQALALAIDRGPIVNVLAQHNGEAAFGLLPQWLSGYAFLFQSTPDVPRAKQMVSQLRLAAVSLSYPANDLFLRSVAERVALNARDAGIAIQPMPGGNGNLRLAEFPMESTDAAHELLRIAPQSNPPDLTRPESLYQLERTLLDEHRIIPLVHLRETYGIAPRVHSQKPGADSFELHLEDAWVDQRAAP
jgi:ABC-type transport system substrate-binding protein